MVPMAPKAPKVPKAPMAPLQRSQEPLVPKAPGLFFQWETNCSKGANPKVPKAPKGARGFKGARAFAQRRLEPYYLEQCSSETNSHADFHV